MIIFSYYQYLIFREDSIAVKKAIYFIAVTLLVILAMFEAALYSGHESQVQETGSDRLPDDAYDAILGGEKFYDTGTQEYLDVDCISKAFSPDDVPLKITAVTRLDIDHDTIPEMILRLTIDGEPNHVIGHEILRFQDSNVYGYALFHREFNHLKSDGSFSFSDGASNWGFATIAFTGDGLTIHKIIYCETSNHPTTYIVDGQETTEEMFWEECEIQDGKADAEWEDFTRI